MAYVNKKVLSVITGASRGIGEEIALQVGKSAGNGSAIVLIARNIELLNKLKDKLNKINQGCEVYLLSCDLEQDSSDLSTGARDVITKITSKSQLPFDSLLLVHNAGTIGAIDKKAIDLSDSKDWHAYLQLNLISMIELNNAILSIVNEEKALNRFIINITSLCACKAFPSMAQYSTVKAAREAYYRSVVVEEPSLRVLNYSPGPVMTDMYDEIGARSYDDGVRSTFIRRTDSPRTEFNRRALTPAETVEKLMKIVETNDFVSGSRVDYFDD